MYENRVVRYNLLRQLIYVPHVCLRPKRSMREMSSMRDHTWGLNPRLGHNYRSTLTCMKFCPSRGLEVKIGEKRSEKAGR